MSILLDALRKSEKIQRKVAAPTIHAHDHAAPATPLVKRGFLILLAAVLLIVGGWFVWQRLVITDNQQQESTTLASNTPQKITTPVVRLEADGKVVYLDPGVKQADSGANRQRTPVEKFQGKKDKTDNSMSAGRAKSDSGPQSKPPTRSGGKAQTKPQPKSKAKSKSQPDTKTESKPGTKPLDAAKDDVAAARTAAMKRNQTGVKPGASTVKQPSGQPDRKVQSKPVKASPQPAPIGYWELPGSVREGVPEIKFSVLVFAENPADRFVLINGQRLKENDEMSADLRVKQIRRDGVVFKYRLYEFLVER